MINEYLVFIIFISCAVSFLLGAVVACSWTHWRYRFGIAMQNERFRHGHI